MVKSWEEFAERVWRKALAEAIADGDKNREKYARNILENVLKVKVE